MSDGHERVSQGEMLLTISTQGETIRGLLSRVDDLEVQDEAQWVTLRAERANAEHLVTLVERLERQVRELQGHLHVRLESGSEFIGYPEELPA